MYTHIHIYICLTSSNAYVCTHIVHWPRYDIFSAAVHVDRPYGALDIFNTGGSVVGVGVET